MIEDALRIWIDEILEQALEAKALEPGEFRDAKLLAYNEILSSLKSCLIPFDPARFGLGMDLDRLLS
ncbi:MAG: hypothetical protein LBS72_03260 [Oscillospiraceae bacterium]|nr:hypothetical protein [Oscillospiraceae bacterium]